ncbi:MAG: hypothetical protein ACYS22_14320 [Planctomycetota bacterium]|jgi:hypothetical protein
MKPTSDAFDRALREALLSVQPPAGLEARILDACQDEASLDHALASGVAGAALPEGLFDRVVSRVAERVREGHVPASESGEPVVAVPAAPSPSRWFPVARVAAAVVVVTLGSVALQYVPAAATPIAWFTSEDAVPLAAAPPIEVLAAIDLAQVEVQAQSVVDRGLGEGPMASAWGGLLLALGGMLLGFGLRKGRAPR